MSLLYIIQINIEIMLSILCGAIYILTVIWEKENRKPYRYIWIVDLLAIGLLLTDVFAIYYRGDTSVTGYYMVRVANFLNFMFLYGTILYYGFFIEHIFNHPKKGKVIILIAKLLASLAMGVTLINLFVPVSYSFDEQNKYFRLSGWYVNAVCSFIAIALLTSIVIRLRSELETSIFWMLLIEVTMPVVASIVQIFIYGIAITDIAIGFTQFMLFLVVYRYQEEKIKEREILLEEYNAKLMLTQVQPHFMLNTLSTIQYLCKTDSEAAFNTIGDFGEYLRNNMDFAASTDLISFKKELSHIEKYMSIEKMRFGDRVQIKYDIREKNFDLPPLSVQPLIENAIKHGISKKRKGGTVELSTWRNANEIHIQIKDDGIGYDMNKPFSPDRVHLGLTIVKDRLQRMCGGNMVIHSEPNQGTVCEITIPIEIV